MKLFQRYISILLLAVVSVLFSPKELLHELLEHHDTEDVACADVCAHHVTIEHRHCDVLQLSTPPFHRPLNDYSFLSDELLSIISFESTSSFCSSASPFLFFRGPPSLI